MHATVIHCVVFPFRGRELRVRPYGSASYCFGMNRDACGGRGQTTNLAKQPRTSFVESVARLSSLG